MNYELLKKTINLPLDEKDLLPLSMAIWKNHDPEYEEEMKEAIRKEFLKIDNSLTEKELMSSYISKFKEIREDYLYFKRHVSPYGHDSFDKADFLRNELDFDPRNIASLYFDAVNENDPRGYYQVCLFVIGNQSLGKEERRKMIEENYLQGVSKEDKPYIKVMMEKFLGNEESFVNSCLEGIRKSNYDSAYQLANYYYVRKDYENCEQFANMGRYARNPDAIHLLAKTRLEEGFSNLDPEAGKCYLMAATYCGSKDAAYELGTYLLNGKFNGEIDIDDAIDYFEKGIKNGSSKAAYSLYQIYKGEYPIDGEMIKEYIDEERAKETFEKYRELEDKEKNPTKFKRSKEQVGILLIKKDLEELFGEYYKKFGFLPPLNMELTSEMLEEAISTNTPILEEESPKRRA